jgi:hypothetical protein
LIRSCTRAWQRCEARASAHNQASKAVWRDSLIGRTFGVFTPEEAVTVKPASLLEHLESLPDPRAERNRKHLLVDVVAIAVCGVLVGCDGPTAIRLWAEQREDWLRGFLTLPEGLPSKGCFVGSSRG